MSTTTTAPTGSPTRSPRPWEVPATAFLVVAALVAVLLDGPVWLRTTLVLLALAATAARLSRHRRRGGLDAAMVAVGGVLVVLVLAGLALGIARTGLGPVWWGVGMAVIALAALAASALRPPTAASPFAADEADEAAEDVTGEASPVSRRSWWLVAPWAVAAVAITVVAFTVATDSANDARTSPVEMSFASLDGPRAEVVLTASEDTGPLELRTDPGDGSAVTYPLLEVEAGTSVTTTVVVPTSGRITVTVNNPGQTQPLRTLVVNR